MAKKQSTGLTGLGKFFVFLIIIGLLAAGIYLGKDKLFPARQGVGNINLDDLQKQLESPDLADITTVQEYKYVPQEKLPPVKDVSTYQWNDKEKIVKFPINIWIGWLPIIAANHGHKPNTESIFYKK